MGKMLKLYQFRPMIFLSLSEKLLRSFYVCFGVLSVNKPFGCVYFVSHSNTQERKSKDTPDKGSGALYLQGGANLREFKSFCVLS